MILPNPVSIVVPTYNHAQFVCRAIDSCINQTYSPVEIIVVDDGSTDDTRERLQPYASKIRYHYQANRGLGAARNAGISLAQGEFIQLLDADDTIDPDKIEKQIAPMLEDQSIDLVYSDFEVIEGNRRRFKVIEKPPQTREDLVRLFFRFNPFQPNSTLIRKRVFDSAGGFDESRNAQEDWELWLRLACDGYKFHYLPGVLSAYRRDGSRITRDPNWMYSRYRHMFDQFESSPRLVKFGERLRRDFIYNQNIVVALEMYNFRHWSRVRHHLLRSLPGDNYQDRLLLWSLLVKTLAHELIDTTRRVLRRVIKNRQD